MPDKSIAGLRAAANCEICYTNASAIIAGEMKSPNAQYDNARKRALTSPIVIGSKDRTLEALENIRIIGQEATPFDLAKKCLYCSFSEPFVYNAISQPK